MTEGWVLQMVRAATVKLSEPRYVWTKGTAYHLMNAENCCCDGCWHYQTENYNDFVANTAFMGNLQVNVMSPILKGV